MVIEKIFEHAHNTPDRIAIYDDGRPISYREFAFWISRVRHTLGGHNLRAGSVAALSRMRKLDLWAFGLALRSLGLTTIHLPALAALGNAGLRELGCVVTSNRNTADRIPPTTKVDKIIKVRDRGYASVPPDTMLAAPAAKLPVGGHIVLTSGTTGVKKKVLIESAHLAANLPQSVEIFGFSENSIVNLHSYTLWTGIGYKFPSCIWSLGGAVVFYSGHDQHRSLVVDGITHTFWNPSLLSAVLRAPANEIRRHEKMRLCVGGSRLPVALALEAKKLLTPNLFTIVSSTEAWTWAFTRIEGGDDLRSHCIHPSREVQVVDESDRPVPAGRRGIVRVRITDGLTGYLHDEEASRKCFRDGYFYPGDLGTFLPNGRLTLDGRVNDVINMFGSKIAAGPIEAALQESLGVEGVCIFSISGEDQGDELHVALEARQRVDEADVTLAIRQWLPAFSHPHVHFVRALPRNAGGKIDRGALRLEVLGHKTG
jgi:acyl-CoA synthetase (AMP-forming)/AMP-acid ligase II